MCEAKNVMAVKSDSASTRSHVCCILEPPPSRELTLFSFLIGYPKNDTPWYFYFSYTLLFNFIDFMNLQFPISTSTSGAKTLFRNFFAALALRGVPKWIGKRLKKSKKKKRIFCAGGGRFELVWSAQRICTRFRNLGRKNTWHFGEVDILSYTCISEKIMLEQEQEHTNKQIDTVKRL